MINATRGLSSKAVIFNFDILIFNFNTSILYFLQDISQDIKMSSVN